MKNNIYIKPNGTDKINLGWSDLPDNITLDIEGLAEYKTIKHANYIAGSLYEWKSAGGTFLANGAKVCFATGA